MPRITPRDWRTLEKISLRVGFRFARQEKRWGLYENPSAIGTQDKWSQLLAEKGVRLAGHRLLGAFQITPKTV